MANMMVHQAEVSPRQVVEVSRWSEWCLENTLSLLKTKFPPSSAIWLVRPCRMLRRLFSSYHHFVRSSITGVPTYSTHHGALLHLHTLLTDTLEKDQHKLSLVLSISEIKTLPLVIIGFSKGCVVLNQIIYEMINVFFTDVPSESRSIGETSMNTATTVLPGCHNDNQETTPTNSSDREAKVVLSEPLPLNSDELTLLKQIVSRIKSFYWLDSGHSGDHGAWVIENEPLKYLATLQIPIHIDITPQQVRDPTREWIGEEEAEFVAKLRQFGAAVVMETLHFEHEEKSLEKHFQVLREFKP